MASFRDTLRKLGSLLQGKKPKPAADPRFTRYGKEELGAGTTGAGWAHDPDKRDWDKVKPLTGSDIEQFLYEQMPLHVNSSNVAMAQYFPT